ncbi:MAG: hypothetical protein JRC99_13305 [Deltaproteobacteria bacterium]|nr:hypothetical protein [Deltaproteobacteria bacterium]
MRKPTLIAVMMVLVVAVAAIFLARYPKEPSSAQTKPPYSPEPDTSQAISLTALPPASALPEHTSETNDFILLMQAIKSAMNAGDFSRALAFANRLMDEYSNDEIALIRARILSSLGRQEEAFEALDDLLATSADSEILRQAAARYFIVARDADLLSEALARQQGRLNNQPDDPVTLRIMAQLYAYARDQNNELQIREHLQSQHGTPENLARIIEIQNSLGLADDASASVAELAKTTDANTATHLLLKQTQTENAAGRADLAVLTAKRGLALNDVSAFMSFRFARELTRAGDDASALTTFELLAENGESLEVRERAVLEICRIRLERGEKSNELSEQLTQLLQSRVLYVQEQAAQLLQQTQ